MPGTPDPTSIPALPERFRAVPYVGARHPEAVPAGDIAAGANCQLYAYAYLAHHGLYVPPLRSSELYADTAATVRVDRPAALDLVLFDAGPRPGRPDGYGAHVGVHVGPDRVLHLSREVGVPALWTYAEFAAHPSYTRLFAIKRCRNRGQEQNGTPA